MKLSILAVSINVSYCQVSGVPNSTSAYLLGRNPVYWSLDHSCFLTSNFVHVYCACNFPSHSETNQLKSRWIDRQSQLAYTITTNCVEPAYTISLRRPVFEEIRLRVWKST